MTTLKIEQHYRKLLNRVYQELSELGFDRVGDEFAKDTSEMFRLVGFQRSSEKSNISLKFTINVGIISRSLLNLMGEKRSKCANNGHLVKRIGFLLPQHNDFWWTISEMEDSDVLFAEIIGMLHLAAIPFLQRFDSDTAFRDYLWNQSNRNLASYEELLYLAYLEAGSQSENGFRMAVKTLKTTAIEIGVSASEIERKLKCLSLVQQRLNFTRQP